MNNLLILSSFSFISSGIELGLIYAVMALGIHISFRTLDEADLSIEGVFPLGCCITALLIYYNVPPLIAVIAALILGGVAGFITSILNTKLKIPMILSGIITMTGLYSINLAILGLSDKYAITRPTLAIDTKKTIFASIQKIFLKLDMSVKLSNTLSTYIIAILVLLIVFIGIYYLFGTEMGMALRATGDNEKMAKAQGINTNLMKTIGLVISNGLIALAGSLFAQNTGASNVTSGRGMIVSALASIIIGEAIFGRKTYKIQLISIIIGSIIYYLLRAIAIELGVVEFLDLVSAVLIVIILSLPLIKKKFRKGTKNA